MKKSFLLAMALCASAMSHAGFSYSYNFTFDNPSASYTISNLYLIEAAPGGVINGGFNLGLRYPGAQIVAPSGGTIKDYFPTDSQATEAIILGVTQDLPGDAPGQKHIVMTVDPTTSTYAEGIAWGTLFRDFQEEQIIYGLEHFVDPDEATRNAALQVLGDFAYSDAKFGVLDNLAESHSVWFTPGSSFKVMSWSDGLVIGNGTSTVTAVPEPATMAVLGLGALGLLRKRKSA